MLGKAISTKLEVNVQSFTTKTMGATARRPLLAFESQSLDRLRHVIRMDLLVMPIGAQKHPKVRGLALHRLNLRDRSPGGRPILARTQSKTKMSTFRAVAHAIAVSIPDALSDGDDDADVFVVSKRDPIRDGLCVVLSQHLRHCHGI